MLGVRVPPGLPFILAIIRGNLMDKVKAILEKVKTFLKEAKVELRKVAWPSRKQTLTSTSVVILLVVVVSIFLGIIDFGIAHLLKWVLG